jgi:hypothetical protein
LAHEVVTPFQLEAAYEERSESGLKAIASISSRPNNPIKKNLLTFPCIHTSYSYRLGNCRIYSPLMSISRFFTIYKGAAPLLYPYLSGDYFLYNILHVQHPAWRWQKYPFPGKIIGKIKI